MLKVKNTLKQVLVWPKKLVKKLKRKEHSIVTEESKIERKFLRLFKIKSRKQLALIGVLAAVVLFIALMGLGIYQYRWEDDFTHKVSKVIPYPALVVNGDLVSYNTYLKHLNILKKYEHDFKNVDFTTDEGKKELESIRKDTVSRLVETAIIRKEAKRLDVYLDEEELNQGYDELIKSQGGEQTFVEVLDKYYGISKEAFKNDIYKDRLIRQKLMEKYQTDESLSEEARKQAEEILAKAKAGEDFATLAKTYSQDSTASEGGDLGLFEKGKMLPEFENVAFAMKVGEISDLVRTIYGYHIIKVTEIKGEQVRSSHILIKTVDFQTWLDEAVENASVRSLVGE